MTEGRVREIVGEAFDEFMRESQYHPEYTRRILAAIGKAGV
jgi:hypothetical protein